LAASPLITPMTLAATPGERRLVVIILRGGMDGMGTIVPYGDPDFATLRAVPDLGQSQLDLDGFFAMDAGLAPLMPLWDAEELGFVHAVSTPYRNKRSHFDGQDILEAGLPDLTGGGARDGWLNRVLATLPDAQVETGFAVGDDALPILRGDHPVSRWTPSMDLTLSPQALRLAQLVMKDDPAMDLAFSKALDLADSDGDPVAFSGGMDQMMSQIRSDMSRSHKTAGEIGIARFAVERLMGAARIVSFSVTGWDTHARQDRLLTRKLGVLARVILALKEGLSPDVWGRTTVLAMTEFGRTARFNGTGGTDHGTGGAMLFAGGAVRGGRVISDWPGLAEVDLHQRRDLMPTRDVRAFSGWALHDLFGIEATRLTRDIFPGVDLGVNPNLLR
jgi:uncharacterized protein (DUF1501 family)